MIDLRDNIAALMWRSQATDVGAPESVAIARTPEAFADESDTTRATWLRLAVAIIAALPDMVAPLVWDEWDGGLTSACTPWGKYILGQDLCLSIPGNGSLRRYETEFAAKAAANAHHAAAVVAAFTGSKQLPLHNAARWRGWQSCC